MAVDYEGMGINLINAYFCPHRNRIERSMFLRTLCCLFILNLVLPAGMHQVYAQEYKSVAERSKEADGGKYADEQQDDDHNSRKEKKRKKKRKEKEAYSKEENQPLNQAANPESKQTTAQKKQEISYPESKKKKRYKVSVVVPLFLDELVRGESVTFRDKVPEKAAPGLAFFQGVKLAADSLRRAGMKMDICIFDAGSFNESPEMLITNRKLDSADLILGAVEQHDIPVLAGYAKKKKINFVSALSNYDGWVKDNQYFTMLQPTVKSHCEFIIDDLSSRFAGKNVTLLYRTSSLADDNAALYILNDLYSEVTFRKLLCNSVPSREVLAGVLDTTKPNILVISILDAVYADSLLRALSTGFPDTHFEIYGMPGWNSIKELRKAPGYKNLTVNVTYPFNFEQADSTLIRSLQCKFSKDYTGVPTEMVWRGYETMLWYGTLLHRYGTIFNNDYKDLSGAPFTRFRVKPRWDRNGSLLYLENKQIYMYTYQGGVYRTN